MARDRYYEEDDLDRGMWEKAGDEVRSWFGDEEAERRRHYDEMHQQHPGDRRATYRGPHRQFRDEVTGQRSLDDPNRGGRWLGDSYPEDRSRSGVRSYGRHGQGYGPQEFRRGFETRDYVGRGYPNSQGHGYVREPATQSHRGLGPIGYQRSDERIRDDVHEALTWDHAVDARHIQVKVENGEVTLEGTVPDRFQKRAAEDALDDVRGMHDVHNHLRIGSQSGEGKHTAGPTKDEV